MDRTLTEICAHTRNYFIRPSDVHVGKYTVSGSTLAPLDFLKDGQYFRIVGSVFNDGVHQYREAGTLGLVDEEFDGAVWAMAIPPAVVALAAEIKAYRESEGAKPSPYTSESFGNYSYTKATDGNGAPLSWQSAFASRLNQYRRLNIL